ncbi:WD40-repeat-containing domain protein [Syncephalis fuscata]|nr:WD40-repeat-containing domain protein [Syncephalis fuscata]
MPFSRFYEWLSNSPRRTDGEQQQQNDRERSPVVSAYHSQHSTPVVVTSSLGNCHHNSSESPTVACSQSTSSSLLRKTSLNRQSRRNDGLKSSLVSSRTHSASPSTARNSAISPVINLTRMFSTKNINPRQLLHKQSSDQASSAPQTVGVNNSISSQSAGLGIDEIYMHDNDSGRGIDVLPQIDFIARLSTEMSLHILGFTDEATLRSAAQVNRYWYELANDNELWRKLYYHNSTWNTRAIPQQQKQPISWVYENETVPTTSHVPINSPVHYKNLYHTRKTLDDRWKRGDLKTQFLSGHSDSVYCVHFDDDSIFTGSRDHTIRQWDVRSGQCVRTIEAHAASVLCLRRHGNQLVTGSSDCTASIWNLPTFTQGHRLVGHTAGVLDVCIDEELIVTCSKDTTLRVWDRITGECKHILYGHRGPVNAIQMKDGIIVSASGDATIRVWDAKTYNCLRTITGHVRGLACVRFDGKHIVSGSNDRTIRVWDVHTGDCLQTLEGHKDLVRSIWFNDQWIASGSYDLTVKIWDRKTGRQTLDLLNGHEGWIFDVQFNHSKVVR